VYSSSPWQNCGTGVSPVVFMVTSGVSESLFSLLPRAAKLGIANVFFLLCCPFEAGMIGERLDVGDEVLQDAIKHDTLLAKGCPQYTP